MLLTDLNLYCLSVLGLKAYLSPYPNIWLYLSPHSRARMLLLLISFTLIKWHCRRYCRERKLFSIALHVPIAWRWLRCSRFPPHQQLRPYKDKTSVSSLTRKIEEGRKLTHDPKTYQISELKNGNFFTIFLLFFLFACLFLCFNNNKCVLNTS